MQTRKGMAYKPRLTGALTLSGGNAIAVICLLASVEWHHVRGHGRLVEPPSRSSAWRFGFKTEPNYNDHELFCGGFTTQWNKNNGKCGICGDAYDGRRDNELPDGKYTKPLVVSRTYKSGDQVTAKVELTANHNGFFEFKLCPATNEHMEVTQRCLDSYPLKVLNSWTTDRYVLPSNKAETFDVQLELPAHLSCQRCVLQWTYTSANNWGQCDDGSSAVGCGPQETFRNCADIKIISSSSRPFGQLTVTIGLIISLVLW